MLTPLERFTHAVHSRDAAALRLLLPQREEVRAFVNDPLFAFDAPALVTVARRGPVELIDALLELGADPNRRSSWWAGGFHPLYSAFGTVADQLLEAGAIPDACAAAHLDRADLLTAILKEAPSRVHDRGGDGQTPLHFARSRRVVDLLLEAGADLDARDVDHRSTPAHWMLGDEGDPRRSRLPLAAYLVERGATTDIFLAAAVGATNWVRAMLEANPALLSLRTGQGEYGERPPSSYHIYMWTIGANLTPLHAAAHFGQTETVEVMRALASVEQRLLLACHEGDRDEALAIVRSNPGLVERLGEEDRHALTDAAAEANANAVEVMLQLGFDPGLTSASTLAGGTALHCAAWKGSVACVASLLRHPAGLALLHQPDKTYQGTPLGWCCHGSLNCGDALADHAEVARMLLAAGARATSGMIDASAPVRAVIEEWVAGR